MTTIAITILTIMWVIILLLGVSIYFILRKSRQRNTAYHVTVKFVGGNKTKLVLNNEQYEQLQAVLNQKDGMFEIGDDLDNVKIYREHVCAVEVKKK